ncbi:MAG: glycosyltransferase [Calothrix sp. C42_A2020_038]|nr:glycosyltransferase [Calothrix sp. C42_A2020_038]
MVLKYVQVLDALDFGDAVSNQTIRIHQILQAKGEHSRIFSKYADHRVEKYRQNISEFVMDEDTIIIHHFSGYSEIAEFISDLRGYKILIYHNITPHKFFKKGERLYEFCKKGRIQLQKIITKYDLVVGDSIYNTEEAESMGARKVKELPIIVPNLCQTTISDDLVNSLRTGIDKVWLFVGRIAPNKRQDILVDIFANYVKLYPNEKHHLYLVGKYFEEDSFYQKVHSKINLLGLSQQITLTGKVEDEYLQAYYKAADIFLCMSEHEGFCVPIVEAFHSHVPVIAYACTAVASTVGQGLGALDSLNIESAVERIHKVFTNPLLKQDLINYGLNQAKRFSPEAVSQILDEILDEITAKDKHNLPLRISVVICTCNRSDYLQRCLTYLKDQDYPHFEVVVVNGPSTDNTMDVLAQRKDIKVVQNPLRNLSISRNLGIQYASGDIIAFIDDDALPYDNWLSKIAKRYHEVPNNVVGIGGRTFFANKLFFQFESGISDSFGRAAHVQLNDERLNQAGFYKYLMGTNSTFTKKSLIAVDGFDEQYDYYLDETDLAVRLQKAGGVLVNANEAYVRHEFAQSHNRLGKYNFNWKVIAKNTVYFGMKNAREQASLPKRILVTFNNILQERCLSFFHAWRNKDLGLRETITYSYNAVAGALRGYYDSCFPRKLGKNLNTVNSPFLPYFENEKTKTSMTIDIPEGDKLHVLIISQEFPPNSFGGIGAYNHTLAKELMQMGHEVTIISRGPQNCTNIIGSLTHIQIATVEHSDCFPEYPILSKNLAWARKVAKITQDIHKERPISVVESALWDFEGIGILMLRPQFNVPLIVRLVTPLLVSIKMNGWEMSEDFKLCAEMEKELIRCADSVIGISNSIKESVESTYQIHPDARWLVQPLGVQAWPTYTNVSNYGELPKDLKRGSIQILFVGRLESRKGIDVFLKALKLVMPKKPDISVWIAGADIEGWTEKCRQILPQDILSRVQFLGQVDEERRELLYANCDFLVFPSRYESFGLVPLEVMVHNKPVIGARAASIPEVIIDGECGLLFEPDDHKDLAQKILTLVNDESLRNYLANGAKQRVEVLSARNMAKASEKIYASLLTISSQRKTLKHPMIQKFEDNILLTDQNVHRIEDDILINSALTANVPKHELSVSSSDNFNINTEWNVNKPIIITWGKLNSLFNGFIVPKMTKFIHSVLFDSMQRQTYINKALISSYKNLEDELARFKTKFLEEKKNVEDEISTLHCQVLNEKKSWEQTLIDERNTWEQTLANERTTWEQTLVNERTTWEQTLVNERTMWEKKLNEFRQCIEGINYNLENQLNTLQEGINAEKENVISSFGEIKKLLYEVQSLTMIENEITRSEFIYRLDNKVTNCKIINEPKLKSQQNQLRVNLGCGHVIIPDYINVDQREMPGVDVVADIKNLPFEEKTISEILISHVVEHFTEFEIKHHILPYWYKLLKDNGKMVVICPDAKSMILEYTKGNYSWEQLRKVTFGGQDYGGNYHYNMFTSESLSKILLECGFKDVNVVETSRMNGLCFEMEIQAVK